MLCKRLQHKVNESKSLLFCPHGKKEPKKTIRSCFCSECGIDKPICPPSSTRYCSQLHITHGMPAKCTFTKYKQRSAVKLSDKTVTLKTYFIDSVELLEKIIVSPTFILYLVLR